MRDEPRIKQGSAGEAVNLMRRGVPKEYLDASLDTFEKSDIIETLKRYIESLDDVFDDRLCLTLFGNNGTGKTYFSSIVIKESYLRRYKSNLITLNNLIDLEFKSNKSQEDYAKLEAISQSHFLVIDEVGKEFDTKTGSNVKVLEKYLRNAFTYGNVVILCTNLGLENDKNGELGVYSRYGESVKSLLNDSLRIRFVGEDFRTKVFREKKSLKYITGGLR